MTYEQAKELKRGDEVWYIDNDGGEHAANVISVDGDKVIVEYMDWHGLVTVRCGTSEVEL